MSEQQKKDWQQIDTALLRDYARSGYGNTPEQRNVFNRLKSRLKKDWNLENKQKKLFDY